MAKILIVDDDPRIQTLLQQLLRTKGHEGVTAESGHDALDKLKTTPFDLVITDLRMPKMNGMELLGHVKALCPTMPVIMVTAYASEDTTVEAVRRGVFDYLAKPFKIDELMAAIGRSLSAGMDKSRATDGYSGNNASIVAYLASAGAGS
jgi:DNA-binding NtrC family response regulator